jgi:hypothetical protein
VSAQLLLAPKSRIEAFAGSISLMHAAQKSGISLLLCDLHKRLEVLSSSFSKLDAKCFRRTHLFSTTFFSTTIFKQPRLCIKANADTFFFLLKPARAGRVWCYFQQKNMSSGKQIQAKGQRNCPFPKTA